MLEGVEGEQLQGWQRRMMRADRITMTPETARAVLGVGVAATAAEARPAYDSLKAQIEEDLKRAPTPSLEAKYRQRLGEIEEAFASLDADTGVEGNLPDLSKAPEEAAPVGGAWYPELPQALVHPPNGGKASRGGGSGWVWVLLVILILFVVGAAAGIGIYFYHARSAALQIAEATPEPTATPDESTPEPTATPDESTPEPTATPDESSPTPTPGGSRTLQVPDDYSTIQAAIDAADAGDTVHVKAGVYNESVTMKDGIQLIGDGEDQVRVRISSTNAVLICDGTGKGLVSGMTFEHTDKQDTENHYSVIWMKDSGVEIDDSRAQYSDGDGIWVQGGSPTISGCVVRGCRYAGISVTESGAQAVLKNNDCADNAQHGISIDESGGADVEGNTCENNKWNGIFINGNGSTATVDGNQIKGNGEFGIAFDRGGGGEAVDNLCQENSWSGIAVITAGSAPNVHGNRLINNTQWGILVDQRSNPNIGDNQYSGNQSGTYSSQGSFTDN
jgi:parallel beta-helix repeat protein